jgi:transposase
MIQGIMGKHLTSDERNELLVRHKGERDGRVKDRIKAVLMRDEGRSYHYIARALYISGEAARQHVADYLKEDGKLEPENGGSSSLLSDERAQQLETHLEEQLYLRTCDVAAYVLATFGIRYSVSGMTKWLQQHGFSYHKPVGVPAKADGEAQKKWIAWYEALKKSLPDNEKILFLDGVHPTHAVRFACGWIKKGVRKEIPTNGSQKRMNIFGALDLEDMAVHKQEYATLDTEALINFLKYLLASLPGFVLHIILDRAGYHTNPVVAAWIAQQPRLHLHFLPAYSPNLNVIERLWKILHEHTVNNVYSPTFKIFTETILGFFNDTFPQKASLWVDRLTDNFTPRFSPLIPNS